MTSEIVADAPGASEPSAHERVAIVHAPCDGEADTSAVPCATRSLTDTFVAVPPPLFVTRTIAVYVAPIVIVRGLATLVTARSGAPGPGVGGIGGSGGKGGIGGWGSG